MKGSSFSLRPASPLYYISCLEFLLQNLKRWKWAFSDWQRSSTFYCLFVHGYSFYYSKSSYLLKKTDDEKELPSFDALLHLFHPFSPQLPSVPIGLFAPRWFSNVLSKLYARTRTQKLLAYYWVFQRVLAKIPKLRWIKATNKSAISKPIWA